LNARRVSRADPCDDGRLCAAPWRVRHVGYADVPIQGIIGHRQVTDAYLAQLARARGSRLATFDQATAKLHNDVADLIPDS
jgi:hypothetical protein